jgi:hypothetical protein
LPAAGVHRGNDLGVPVHGTVSGYNTGCRCGHCRDAIAAYRRARRRRSGPAEAAAIAAREAARVPHDAVPASVVADLREEAREARARPRESVFDVLSPLLASLAPAPVARNGERVPARTSAPVPAPPVPTTSAPRRRPATGCICGLREPCPLAGCRHPAIPSEAAPALATTVRTQGEARQPRFRIAINL